MLIYLCEDSESDALRLKHHLNTYATKHHCNMEILLFSSGEEMIQYYKEEKRYPALLFLDIYMNSQDGVETARILRSLGYKGGIIFTTSSTEHAMASYEVNALYYLQKPYSHTDFLNAMSRCDTLLEESNEVFTFLSVGRNILFLTQIFSFLKPGSTMSCCTLYQRLLRFPET